MSAFPSVLVINDCEVKNNNTEHMLFTNPKLLDIAPVQCSKSGPSHFRKLTSYINSVNKGKELYSNGILSVKKQRKKGKCHLGGRSGDECDNDTGQSRTFLSLHSSFKESSSQANIQQKSSFWPLTLIQQYKAKCRPQIDHLDYKSALIAMTEDHGEPGFASIATRTGATSFPEVIPFNRYAWISDFKCLDTGALTEL